MKMNWSNGIAEWTEDNTAYISAVFSWNAQSAYMRCLFYKTQGYHVRCGGQAVMQSPAMFTEFDTSGSVSALPHHNPQAVFTSKGCVRKCSFCVVPKLEGGLVEFDNWETKPIICDNNLLATSQLHFDRVINQLLESKINEIDFNQGLDARLLTDYHARRLSELPTDTIIRLAWDNIKTEQLYLSSFERLINAGTQKKQIRTYVLIGYKDTPKDALYRLEKIRELGSLPNPMRFQPLNTTKKNSFVDASWTGQELKDYMRYFSRLNWLGHIPFSEYSPYAINKIKRPSCQDELFPLT